ncbi:tetratricopeptide repeat protein [Fulvivirgaceae bacterium BMA10]|uniref:Tetratricopeptide repeat protein n=1 Tax=Splendidivirga corallicola TaxID=3051826 RepID=A0ABT8KSU6_9BACT|nr:tetratricopeptide repeat protein [Fulvivirgaceae bacterium BMA10]
MLSRVKFTFILCIFNLSLNAQTPLSQVDNDRHYKEGLELLDKEQYAAARLEFEEFLKYEQHTLKAINAEYYAAYSAMSLYHQDGEDLIKRFVSDHSKHPKAVLAYYELGNFYYRQKDYKKATEYFEQVDLSRLSDDQRVESRFKMGYAYFSRKSFDKSLEHFNAIKNTDSEYMSAANYYAGYIEFRNESYEAALIDLQRAEKNEAYAAIVPYMIANVYYKQGLYDDLIDYGDKIKNEGRNLKNKEDFNLLVGEAHFQNKDYAKAADFFEAFAESGRYKSDREVLYRVGYTQYLAQKFDKAQNNFKVIASGQDELAQYASYYLGLIYIKEGNQNFALSAFDKARKLNFNTEIKEEASFKYAKVNFESGRYADAIDAFHYFLEKYPRSKLQDEANDLLSEAYLNTSDYDQAIKHIEGLGYKSQKVKETYQKVTFYKGTENFNNGKYYRAVKSFEKSLEYPIDKEMVIQANFWSGEAYSIGKRYDDAIRSYQAVFGVDPGNRSNYTLKTRYSLGYAYYNTKRYDQAREQFNRYINQPKSGNPEVFYNDALIRTADCYYVNKEYNNAVSFYDRAIKGGSEDIAYAYFQKGVILGIQNKVGPAKENFDRVINRYASSNYYDNAIYQKAQLDFEQGNYQQAINGFTYLIKNNPESGFVPYALLKRGFSNYNLQKYDLSINDYKKVLDEHIAHPTASSAVSSLQEVLTLQNRSAEFQTYLTKYKTANPNNESLETIEYETAKTLYNNQEYQRAISAFQSYIQSYSQNINAFEAKYFIAECYYRLEQDDEALRYYYEVESDNKIARVRRSVQRIAELEHQKGQYEKAIAYYQKLEKLAKRKKDTYNAWEGQMESYFQLAKYDSSSRYANKIQEGGSYSINALNKATLYLGKIALAQKNYDAAIDEFIKTSNAVKDEYGAEAQYLMGKIFYDRKEYRQSIETLIDLNTNFASYDLWLGKAFLLIADNYIGLEEFFQAEGTLNSVIERSPLPSIVEEAKVKLQQVQELKNKKIQEQETNQGDTTFQEIDN